MPHAKPALVDDCADSLLSNNKVKTIVVWQMAPNGRGSVSKPLAGRPALTNQLFVQIYKTSFYISFWP